MCDRGLVNRIIPFSCVDGPGNRSAVFFQGCDFHCRYCHNPETQNLCIGCGRCVKECPVGALSMDGDQVRWDSEICCGCDTCLKVCTNSSSPKVRWMSVDEILKELDHALPFITGVTVSGGECTRYDRFIARLFDRVHQLGKTAFCDTNGQRLFSQMPELTAAMDKAMLDVKAWDPDIHRRLTGQGNEAVLKNLDDLLKLGKLYEVRTVVIPDYLDNEETVRQVSRKLAAFSGVRYKLIKYRPWGVRPPMKVRSPTEGYMKDLMALAYENGAPEVVIT